MPMIALAAEFLPLLRGCSLIATGTTGAPDLPMIRVSAVVLRLSATLPAVPAMAMVPVASRVPVGMRTSSACRRAPHSAGRAG